MPEPGAGEVLLRLRVAAIGATEQAALAGRLAVSDGLGSEFTADVVHDPEGTLNGARVAPLASVPCGACGPCLDGTPSLCPVRIIPGRSPRHGCLAEYFPFPRQGLVQLAQQVRDYDAISLLPLAAALTLSARMPLPERILVVSDGGLGIVAAAALRQRKLHLYLANAAPDAVESVRRFSLLHDPGGRFPLVVAACDGPGVLGRAMDRVTPRGTLAVLGIPHCVGSALSLVHRELTVIGLGEGDVVAALRRLEELEACEILSRARPTAFPFDQALQALACASAPGSLRVIVDNMGSRP